MFPAFASMIDDCFDQLRCSPASPTVSGNGDMTENGVYGPVSFPARSSIVRAPTSRTSPSTTTPSVSPTVTSNEESDHQDGDDGVHGLPSYEEAMRQTHFVLERS